ncbi:MAG: D-alanine--D-alanine ligase [Phycisphaeraceae bacterium]|nr:D-alanine--D-alanine ligase [Phycisphaeraceae bacterium]
MMRVLVLAGGPDREREVSLDSARGVADALRAAHFEVHFCTIERPGLDELRALPGDVIFPVLHGPWGEGGPLQDLLALDGRPFVGCGPDPARIAMDKLTTLARARAIGVPTLPSRPFVEGEPPLALPVVVKPVTDGSSVGVRVCRDRRDWQDAAREILVEQMVVAGRRYMVERFVSGQEITCAVLDGRALPLVRIRPAAGFYDYQAKYARDDTRYDVSPELGSGVTEAIRSHAEAICRDLGVRHLARVDFMLEGERSPWLLEVNTMPGFTSHSLFPMAASAVGLDMPRLCAHLIDLALRGAAIAGAPT